MTPTQVQSTTPIPLQLPVVVSAVDPQLRRLTPHRLILLLLIRSHDSLLLPLSKLQTLIAVVAVAAVLLHLPHLPLLTTYLLLRSMVIMMKMTDEDPFYREGKYMREINQVLEIEGEWIDVDAHHVFDYNPDLYNKMVRFPLEVLTMFDIVLMDMHYFDLSLLHEIYCASRTSLKMSMSEDSHPILISLLDVLRKISVKGVAEVVLKAHRYSAGIGAKDQTRSSPPLRNPLVAEVSQAELTHEAE
ncbi:hypothetical protein ACFE04_021399 [Oxalis oulophora]